MADWIIKDTTLRRIADKVRGLNDSGAKILVKNIADNIPEKQDKSVAITENGTQTIRPDNGKILGDVIIETNVEGGNKPEQAKTINVTANGTQTVKPDTGKTLSQVTVITNVEGSEVVLQEKTVSPSVEQQQVRADPGYTALSQVTVEPVLTEEKTVTPAATGFYVLPTTGKYLTRVKVNAVPAEEKTITENGEYIPENGFFFSKVTVNVPKAETQVKTVDITENNKTVYIFPDSGKTLSHVVANVRVPGTDFGQVTAEAADVRQGKVFFDKTGSKTYGAMPTYNGEFFAGIYPPTVSVASNTLMWSAVEGAEGYRIYKQVSSSEWEMIAEQSATEYNLLNMAVGNYTLYVTAYADILESPNSNIVQWVKASLKYALSNISVKDAPTYFTTNTPATITFERAFGYVLPASVTVDMAQQNSYTNGVLVISQPTSAEVTVTASGVKDTSATIEAGSYQFAAKITAIKETLEETVNFTYASAGTTNTYTAIVAQQNGAIVFKNGDANEQVYNGTTWNTTARTITVTSTAHVSADFLEWFNNAMQKKLSAPVIRITSDGIISWSAVSNATSYDIRDGATVIATTTYTNFDINPYGKTMGAGEHNITVVAKADYFSDSVPSNTVVYTVYSLTTPANVQIQAQGSDEVLSWDYTDSNATGADIYEETTQGVYTKLGSVTRDDSSPQYVISSTESLSIGSHNYVVKSTNSVGKYADSAYSSPATVGIYKLAWNTIGIVKPSRNVIADNETYTTTIVSDSGSELPETIDVQGASHTWNATSGLLQISNVTATSYQTGVTVIINAVVNAKIEAGTYYWITDPTLSSTYIEANFTFKSGGTTYTKLSSGNGDFIKYNNTTVYSMSGGATWEPETARIITVSSDQYIPQTAYDFFFANSLKKQLSTPTVNAYNYEITWSKSTGATEYEIYVDGTKFGSVYDIHDFLAATKAGFNFDNTTLTFTRMDYNYSASPSISGKNYKFVLSSGAYWKVDCGAGARVYYNSGGMMSSDVTMNIGTAFAVSDGGTITSVLVSTNNGSSWTELTDLTELSNVYVEFDIA